MAVMAEPGWRVRQTTVAWLLAGLTAALVVGGQNDLVLAGQDQQGGAGGATPPVCGPDILTYQIPAEPSGKQVYARTLTHCGKRLYNAGDVRHAEPVLQRAVQIDRFTGSSVGDTPGGALAHLGYVYLDTGRLPAAETALKDVLNERTRALGRAHFLVSTSQNDLADVYRAEGHLTLAEPLYREALATREKATSSTDASLLTILSNLGALYLELGKYEEAKAELLKAGVIARENDVESSSSYGTTLNNLAITHERLGELDKARESFEKVLQIHLSDPDANPLHVASTHTNIGGLFRELGDLDAAREHIELGLKLRQDTLGLDSQQVVHSLAQLAAVDEIIHDSIAARTRLLSALKILERVQQTNLPIAAAVLNALAGIEHQIGNLADAEHFATRAQTILESRHPNREDGDLASTLNTLASIKRDRKEPKAALELFQQAERIASRCCSQSGLASTIDGNLASYDEERHDWKAAETRYLSAVKRLVAFRGEFAEGLLELLGNLGATYGFAENPKEAFSVLERATVLQERRTVVAMTSSSDKVRRAYLRALRGTVYMIVSLQMRIADDADLRKLALTNVLRWKGRDLDTLSRELLRTPWTESERRLLAELVTKRARLASVVADGIGKNTDRYFTAVRQLTDTIASTEAALSRTHGNLPVLGAGIDVDSVRRELPRDAALIEFVRYKQFIPPDPDTGFRWSEERYAVYCVQATGDLQAFDLGEASTLDDLLARWLRNIKTAGNEDAEDLAQKVGATLFGPIEGSLKNVRQLLVAPDGLINLIPFSALRGSNGSMFLDQKYSISYVSSGRDLLRTRVPRPSPGAPVVAGAPDFGKPAASPGRPSLVKGRNAPKSRPAWSSLAGAKGEVEAIGRLLGVKPILAKAATEPALKAIERPRVLHLATHGYFSERPAEDYRAIRKKVLKAVGGVAVTVFDSDMAKNEGLFDDALLRSGVVLAGANGSQNQSTDSDGLLTAADFSNMNLAGTELVVVSACRTAVAEAAEGEGLIGLRRALAMAGSASQLLTLWKVDDDATKAFMIAFYGYLKAGMTRADALKAAQLWLKGQKGTEQPVFWAAFVLSGDWRELNEGSHP